MGSKILDYHYFGPPTPICEGLRYSPYWPTEYPIPWNPREAYEKIGNLLDKLQSVVDDGPYGAIPTELYCECTGQYCMLPVVDRYCSKNGIPRMFIRPPPSLIDVHTYMDTTYKWLLLMPRICNETRWPVLVAALGVSKLRLAVYRAKVIHLQNCDEELRHAWGVGDLDSLCDAIATPDSLLLNALLQAIE